jgi:hypothetical protein
MNENAMGWFQKEIAEFFGTFRKKKQTKISRNCETKKQ